MTTDRPGPFLSRVRGAARAASLGSGSLYSRTWLAVAVFLVLFISGGVLLLVGLRSESASRAMLDNRARPLQTVNFQARSAFASAESTYRAYLLTGESRLLGGYRHSQREVTARLDRATALARGGWGSDIADQRRESGAWFRLADQMHPPAGPSLTKTMDASMVSSDAFYRANERLRVALAHYIKGAVADGDQALHLAVGGGGGLMGAALLLGLVVAVGTSLGMARPLAGVTTTLRRLTSGEHAARASVTGAAETRDVASSVNALADEADRAREQEAQERRLQEMARDVGFRIREHLRAEDVLNEAAEALEDNIDAAHLHLHLLEPEGLGLPIGNQGKWLMPDQFARDFPPQALERLRDAYRQRLTLVVQDVQGPEGEQIPAQILAVLRKAGVASRVIAPFGVGSDMTGFIVAVRMRGAQPWNPAEVATVDSIATALGHGLHHARMYEAESRMVDRLKAVDQAKSDFLALVSHELRTPLTSIAGNVETLSEGAPGSLTGPQRKMLEAVERNTTRLRRLVEDVLTLSKIEAGSFTATMVPFSIADAVPAAVEALGPAAARRQVSLGYSCDGPARGLVVSGDPVQLDRMLQNLLSNAIKFTPEGGAAKLSATTEGAMAVVRVSDTGYGIPERDRKQLFSRFFRASNAVERSVPGTGLGLAIVRTIVDNHGGDIAVDSAEGKGTTITVRIPLSGVGPISTAEDDPAGLSALTGLPGTAR